MKTWKQLQRNVTVVLSGIQEVVAAAADHINQHIQKAKLDFDTETLEEEIQEAQAMLGKEIRRHSNINLHELYEEKKIKNQVSQILEKQKQMESREGIVSPYETLHDFERLLIRSDFVIQNIIIPDEFHGNGKALGSLDLPDQMLIFFIKKKNKIELAYGGVRVDARDEVTFLCSKENIPDYLAFWK
ncbi:MAG: hypothetical protein ACE5F7_02395 [Nitrospiria bacterium]